MLLTKDQILKSDDLPSIIVDVPDWGGEVKVRAMSIHDRIKFEAEQANNASQTAMMVNLVLYTCVNENNERIFDDSDKEMLESKSPQALMKVFSASIGLNILTQEVIEEKAKNS
jgi:hypothetical protein